MPSAPFLLLSVAAVVVATSQWSMMVWKQNKRAHKLIMMVPCQHSFLDMSDFSVGESYEAVSYKYIYTC